MAIQKSTVSYKLKPIFFIFIKAALREDVLDYERNIWLRSIGMFCVCSDSDETSVISTGRWALLFWMLIFVRGKNPQKGPPVWVVIMH